MAAKGMGNACIDDDTAAAYVAGALGDGERARVEGHLSGCSACRMHLAQLAETSSKIARPVRSRWDGLRAGDRIGRFVLEAPLGSGGMGVVWSSRDRDLDRRVALKMVRADVGDEALQNRLLREARAMARLTHPNVVAVYDLLVHEGKLVIAMELVEGENLERWLTHGARSFEEVRDAFVAAGRGLAAAHAVGLVHRDFKPENVLVAAQGARVCVTDFGLSSLLPRGAALSTDDETTSHAGTPAYMAPEQLRGEVADAASDQFAFAVGLHRALHGVHPFDGETADARRHAVLEGRLRDVPSNAPNDIPRWLRPVIVRALAPRREDRWPSMDVLLAKLVEDRGTRRRRVAFVIALLTSAGLTVAAVRQGAAHGHRTGCEGKSAWTDAKREETARVFRATSLAYADDTWRTTARTLDRYGAALADEARLSCAKPDDAVELRRRACLEERRVELGALADVLRSADRDVVSSAPAAAESLTPLARCSETAVLRSAIAPPVDPRRAAAVADVRARLAHASALLRTGKSAEALPLAPDIVTAARKAGYAPLEGEALLIHGHLLTQRYDRAVEAERLLYSAIAAADRVGDDRTRARAWAELLFNVGHVRAQEDPWWIREQAEAALVRLGGDDGIATQLENAVAGSHYRRGRFDEAARSARRTVTLAEKTFGKSSVRYGIAVGNLATLLIAIGETEEAIARAKEAERIFVAQLGPKHEQTANVANLIGEAHFMELRHAEAEAHQRRALAIAAEVPMPKLREAKYTADLARTLAETDRTAEAIALAEKSRALFDAGAAPDHPERFTPLLAEATARIAAGEPTLAVAPLERALGLNASGKAVEAAEAERLFADVLVATNGDRSRADALAAHAAEVYAKHAHGARQLRDKARLERRASR